MVVALRGDSMLVGDKCTDDGGMRKRRRLPGSFLEEGAAPGVGGGSEVVADLTGSLNANEPLTALAGCDVDELVGGLSRGNLGKLTPALTGLANTGVRALRKSV